jgi:hypothetical protein
MVETSNGEELMEHSPTFAESFSPQLVTFITKAWILCKLYICFDDVYRENFGFSGASVKDHEKLSANRNFVVELVHFEVKRRKNYRIPGSKTLTFL